MLSLFGDEHANRGRLQVQLSGEAEAGETAAEDHDVVGGLGDGIHGAGILNQGAARQKYDGLDIFSCRIRDSMSKERLC